MRHRFDSDDFHPCNLDTVLGMCLEAQCVRIHSKSMSAHIPCDCWGKVAEATTKSNALRSIEFDFVLDGDVDNNAGLAIADVLNEIARRRTAIVFKEHSPVTSSQSNGFVESAIQSVEGQILTMKDAMEDGMGSLASEPRLTDQNVLSWLIGYAGVLITRNEVGDDGKAADDSVEKGQESSV